MAAVSTVYARALFEVSAADAPKTLAAVKEFLELWNSNKALRTSLVGAGIHSQKRLEVLNSILSAASIDGLSARFLRLLVSKGRIQALPEIVKDLESMVDASMGITVGTVRSAVELSGEEINVLSAALGKRVGTKVRLRASVDSSLLGGVVADVAGKTFDASLKTQIERFRNELI